MASSVSFTICILTVVAVLAAGASAAHHASAPAPAVDCSTLVLNMADCLSYVSNDSTVTKPEGTCCSGLKTVIKTDAECLCEAFKSSAQLGVVLNITKALALPTACKLHSPTSSCGMSLVGGGAPAASPLSATAPSMSAGSNEQTPAPTPSPGASDSHGLSVSFMSLFVGLLFCVFA